MTERIGNVVLIAVEPDSKCEKCGEVRETRPYGFGGVRICYPCFDGGTPELKAEVKRRFGAILDGVNP